MKKQKIGILGGTFNPIHLGHLILAEQARIKFKLDKVLFVPTYISPHKKVSPMFSVQDRVEMIKLAIRNNTCFDVWTIEIEHKGISYSIDTVEKLKIKYPKAKLYSIIGADLFLSLRTWKDYSKLEKMVEFIVGDRKLLQGGTIGLLPIEMTATNTLPINVDISSTDIRNRLKKGKSIRYLVTERVYKYIFNEWFNQKLIKITSPFYLKEME